MSDIILTPTLADAFAQTNLAYPGEVEPGRFKRFSSNGKKHDTAGWVKVFPDGDGAVFGCWRDGDIAYTWQRKRDGQPMSRTDIATVRQQVEQARRQAQAERETDYAKAAAKAAKAWQDATQAQTHPYLSTKGIKAHVARTNGDMLVIPVYSSADMIQSLQTIAPDGGKRFMTGGKMAGGRCWLGDPPEPSSPITICEGYATGATIHEATGQPVVVAFNAGNLLAVAQSIYDANPEARIVIAGDDDKATPGNPGRAKAVQAAKAVKGIAVFPECKGSDFNDMAAEQGAQAVADFIRAALEPPPPRFKLLNRRDLANLPELEWRVSNVLPMQGVGLIIGQSGTGKSFVAIDLLARVSLGLDWFGHDTKPCKTVYCALEGRAGIKRRIEAWERQNSTQVPDGFAVVLDSLKLTEPEDVHELARAILAAGGQGGLTIIDTLAQASPGTDENSSADMGLVIEALQRLQALTGGLVLAVHHMGKDTARGARGHSSLYAACDSVISTSKAGALITVSTDGGAGGKSKDAEPVEHIAALDRVVLHTMDDGYEIAGACIVEQEIAPRKELPRVPRGGNMKIVWDALGAMLREAGDTRPADAPASLPEGRPAILLEDAIENVGPMLTCEPKRRNERIRSAITSLINAGNMVHMDGWLWIK